MIRSRNRGRCRGGGSGTSLNDLGLFVAWGDTTNISDLLDLNDAVVTDGTLIKTWKDKSGRGNNLTQATSTARPTYRATAGGMPSIEFFASGAFELLIHADSTDFNISNPFAFYAAVKWKTTTGTPQTIIGKYNPTGNQRGCQLSFNTTPNLVTTTSNDGTSAVLTTSTATDTLGTTTPIVVSVRWDGVNTITQVNETGTSGSGSPAAIFTGTSDFGIGALANASQPFKGYIYGWGKTVGCPTAAQHTQIVNYFKSICGA